MTFISVFIALSACHDDEDLIIADESNKKITVKKLNQKEIKEITPIYEQVVSMNHNIYGRNQDEVYEVSLSNALYITDGTIETYTFPIQTIDSLTKYNLMLNLENGEYKPYLIHYDLTDSEYLAYSEGQFIDFSTKAIGYELESDNITITNRIGTPGSTCTQIELTRVELCDCPQHQAEHIYGGENCHGRTEVWETVMVPCPGGGGGGEGDGLSGTPSGGPGSPGGTYGGPSGSDGSSGGYTGFVIGDGGTGNQDDVDAINQITQEMDAAFGVGNWNYDDSVTESNADYIISNFGELNQIQSSIDISEVSSSVISTNEDIILISKVVRLTDSWGLNSIDVSISFNYNKSTNNISNINSDISGNVFAFGWTHHGSGVTTIQEDWPDTSEFNESIFEIKVQGFWHYSIFVNGIGTVMKSKYEIKFNADTLGNTFIPSFIKLP